ncbi:MAG TPA: ABC transporter substrate-binding protein [Lachnospiraceae bacterium]|nr:ABC transporter substrate-binding protein [Lachnospiraceae bacterium]
MKRFHKLSAMAAAAILGAATILSGCGSSGGSSTAASSSAATTAAAEAGTEAAEAATEAAATAASIDYPTKGITVICPWSAGGGTDACLRAFSDALGKQLGQTLTVDNRTGGGGITGHQAIADAAPDGYTIGMITFELATYKPLGTSDLTYENYDPLCRVNTDAATVTVNTKWAKQNNITDMKSFIDYAKKNPGQVQLGGSSNASVWHIAGGYLMQKTGIDVQMITYQDGAATAVQNAASGFIQGVTVSVAEAKSFIDSGDLTCLGIMDTERNPQLPDVPTMKEQGYDLTYYTQRGMAIPKGVDPAIRAKLQDACAEAIKDPDFIEFMKNNGQTISYMSADDYEEYLKSSATDVESAMKELNLIGQ